MPKVASYSEAAAAANLPRRIKSDELAALGVVTWLSAVGDEARNPETGVMNDGFVVTVEKDGKQYESFVGGKVLTSTLARIDFPFTARIVKSGSAWIFSD